MKIYKISYLFLFFILIFTLAACGKKDESQPKEEEVIVTTTTAEELLEGGESLRCETSQDSEEGSMELVYYFDSDNGRMRMDSKTFVEEEDMVHNSHFITKDDWSYFWDDFMLTDGFKMRNQEAEESSEDQGNLEEEFEFKCRVWQVDDSFFVLPDDKSFNSLPSFLEDVQSGTGSMQDFGPEDMENFDPEDMENFDPEDIEDLDLEAVQDVDVEGLQDIEVPAW